MKSVILTIVLLLSGAAMATERNSSGLLGGYTSPREPAGQSETNGRFNPRTWEPRGGRESLRPEAQKLLDDMHGGKITSDQFMDGLSVLGKEETMRRRDER